MAELLFFGASVASGLVLGWLFVRLWRWCAPRVTNRRFWASLGDITRRMLAVDEFSTLLALYRRLAAEVGGYLLRNLGGLALACLPVGLFLVLVAPGALALWDRGAERLVLYPPTLTQDLGAADDDRALDVALGGSKLAAVEPAAQAGRTAVCWTTTDCLIFRLLAFRVVERERPLIADAPYLVVRAERGDANFLWPYLNDLEFVFICAFMAATVGCMLWHRTAG